MNWRGVNWKGVNWKGVNWKGVKGVGWTRIFGVALLALFLSVAEARVRGFVQTGQAVYYSGRPDRSTRMTAAHPTLPFGTWVRVTHQRTGRSVLVKINDRGPFYNPRRIVDLSSTAARALGIVREGVAPVRLEVIR